MDPMLLQPRIHFVRSDAPQAVAAYEGLVARFGQTMLHDADVIVALGGDGLMLEVLQASRRDPRPVYGMHRGTVGFLMNDYIEDGLMERLMAAEAAVINPLKMTVECDDGEVRQAHAINEVSLLRERHQAAKIRILIDGKERMSELVCDGVMVATPAGSTAYNYSAHGPILPIGAEILALTPISAFRPRRWRGALLPRHARVTLECLDPERRPVSATADNVEVRGALKVHVELDPSISHTLLFDPGHGLEERLIREQFA
ncbi:NAD kinase [Albimonas pacifica]|uniref:NAD kinase n=1 Tax=Albimonas pacifica TaxID=1114924 RepID=A0A1I3HZ57_9RHOB|nr:NAD kinase [Albimonas pacifica]SFI41048.1 NAD+ kinase [Albimonas pacifica]